MQTLNRWTATCIYIFLVSTLLGCTTLVRPKPDTTTTIVLTRHADRDIFSNDLNEKGLIRAEALSKATGDMGITAIYSPDLKRNLDTSRPLAERLGINITIVDSNPNHISVINTLLTKHAGKVVLWVGNTGNLEEIYDALDGAGDPPVSYGDLFIMKISGNKAPEVIKSRYGP